MPRADPRRSTGQDLANKQLRAVAGDPEEVQIMYGIADEREFVESEPNWLPGCAGEPRRGSARVRRTGFSPTGTERAADPHDRGGLIGAVGTPGVRPWLSDGRWVAGARRGTGRSGPRPRRGQHECDFPAGRTGARCLPGPLSRARRDRRTAALNLVHQRIRTGLGPVRRTPRAAPSAQTTRRRGARRAETFLPTPLRI
jgi:hypothetical protein